MPSFARLALLALPVFSAAVSAQDNIGRTCFQDCANSSYDGFPCPGLDLPCYCSLDNGDFMSRLQECVSSNCNEETANVYRVILNNYECPSATTTGGGSGGGAGGSNGDGTTTVTSTATPTGDNDDDDEEVITATVSGQVTLTETNSVTVTTSLSLIGEDFTSTIVATFVTETIITTESDTTRTLTVTATAGAGGDDEEDDGEGVLTTSVPVTTVLNIFTDENGETTTATSTVFSEITTTTTAAESSATNGGNGGEGNGEGDGEGAASTVQGSLFLGLAAGVVALFAM